MRFSVVLAVAAACTSASADLLYPRQIPSCATPCITNANLGGCSATDDKCLCQSQTFVNSVTSCIVNSCTGSDLTNAVAAAQALCAAAGVTLTGTLPTPSSTASSSNSTATSPASTKASSTGTSTTSAATATKTSGAGRSDVNAIAGLAALMAAFGLSVAL